MIDDEEYTLQNQKPILDITKLVNIVIPHDEIYAKVLQDMVDHEELHLWADRKNYSLDGQVLKYREKLVVVVKERQKEIVQQFHNSLIGGHNGVRTTLNKIKSIYHWHGMRKLVREWIKSAMYVIYKKMTIINL